MCSFAVDVQRISDEFCCGCHVCISLWVGPKWAPEGGCPHTAIPGGGSSTFLERISHHENVSLGSIFCERFFCMAFAVVSTQQCVDLRKSVKSLGFGDGTIEQIHVFKPQALQKPHLEHVRRGEGAKHCPFVKFPQQEMKSLVKSLVKQKNRSFVSFLILSTEKSPRRSKTSCGPTVMKSFTRFSSSVRSRERASAGKEELVGSKIDGSFGVCECHCSASFHLLCGTETRITSWSLLETMIRGPKGVKLTGFPFSVSTKEHTSLVVQKEKQLA